MDGDCAVLICTCDAYEDAWKPFFFFFKKYWNCPYPIYLNTERKQCDIDGVQTLNALSPNETWSLRLKNALKRIKEQYVIIMLEDFFLLSPVNQNIIDKCLDWISSDKSISCFSFDRLLKSIENKAYPKFGHQSIDSHYWLNAQAGVWRKKHLTKYLSPYENAWQFEWFGTQRAKLYGYKFYSLLFTEQPIFDYVVDWDTGYGICKGKWLKSNIELFKKHGILVDFENMGFYEKSKVNNSIIPPRKTCKERILYFLYGGCKQTRSPLIEQAFMFLKNPKEYIRLLRNKTKFLVFNNFWT